MQLFSRRKTLDVQSLMLKVINNHSSELETMIEGPRIEGRVRLTIVAQVIPLVDGRPAVADTMAAVTKEFSSSGVSLVLHEPRGLDHVVLGFRWRETIEFVRVVVRQIQGTESVTNEQRVSLMLPVHDTEPTPVPPPQVGAVVAVSATGPHALAVRISDPLNPNSGRKPNGVQGTAIFTCSGEAPLPEGDAGWIWQGQTTRMKGNICARTCSSEAPDDGGR